ncbi:hypothetical protein PENTCL1PPCAC_19520, partial [Pristionchus entomophagus]
KDKQQLRSWISRSRQIRPYGQGRETAHVHTPGQFQIALNTPIRSPRISDRPVVFPIFCSESNRDNCVIGGFRAVRVTENSSAVIPETFDVFRVHCSVQWSFDVKQVGENVLQRILHFSKAFDLDNSACALLGTCFMCLK